MQFKTWMGETDLGDLGIDGRIGFKNSVMSLLVSNNVRNVLRT